MHCEVIMSATAIALYSFPERSGAAQYRLFRYSTEGDAIMYGALPEFACLMDA
jgi:hypothetical protein